MGVLSKQRKTMTVSIVILLDDVLKKRNSMKERKSKSFWVHKLFKERKSSEFFHVLTKELEMFDREYFFSIFKNVPRPT